LELRREEFFLWPPECPFNFFDPFAHKSQYRTADDEDNKDNEDDEDNEFFDAFFEVFFGVFFAVCFGEVKLEASAVRVEVELLFNFFC
jgi:hypothetical protein